MFKKFKSLEFKDKFIIIIFSIMYISLCIKSLINANTRLNSIESVTSFLILFLWLFLYNNVQSIKMWFESNKLRILLTLVVLITFLYINNSILISESFTKQIINLLQSFLISCFLNEFYYRKWIDTNDAVLIIIGICCIPYFLKANIYNIFTFLLITISSYILFGAIINAFKQVKNDKDFIIDIIGIIISIISLIISLIP